MRAWMDEKHSERLADLLYRDKTNIFKDPKDVERFSMFYLLSGIESLYQNIDKIYDFEDHTIKPECLNDSEWTREERKLISLAFNLYNNFEVTPLEVFYGLQPNEFVLAVNAIVERMYVYDWRLVRVEEGFRETDIKRLSEVI
ncbi:DUF6075 family protein [Caldanaerobacter subterraneus]|nr:DUF6075 family protein [Caldanaerobacter subterraneus]